jgi:hypothetical protein
MIMIIIIIIVQLSLSATLLDGEGSISHPGQFIPWKTTPVPTEQEAALDSEPVWMVLEKRKCLALRTPDRSARSQSLYRLRCPVSYNTITMIIQARPNGSIYSKRHT